jgi:hypothetical protein
VVPVLVGSAGLVGWQAAAQPAMPSLAGCLAIADVMQRVACYDAIARAQQAAEPAAPRAAPRALGAVERTPTLTPAPVQARAQPDPLAEFGFNEAEREQRRPKQLQQLDRREAQVESAQQAGPGYWRFIMADGSVWQLAEVRRSFRPPRAGDQVVIRRASLGAYLLDADGQPAMRVRRLK